jgi:hypothetical protein
VRSVVRGRPFNGIVRLHPEEICLIAKYALLQSVWRLLALSMRNRFPMNE